MNILSNIFVPLLAVLIVNGILWFFAKNAEKIDKGLVFNHFKLSYRRRFIGALRGIPLVLIVFLLIAWQFDVMSIKYIWLVAICILLISLESFYYYRKWKEEE
ncbi:hypothetical protein [Lysinibacillus endophyticus]|uniref:hypothetical protein n=1 Tax=Ureibacillus endophyticus TaxID=1978490 RepID=UPI00209FF281|nr:hypothetical protein [Lysinibacillus endophyticus]MCP1144798.1 hypothetical protein [Lysinibacillus endophyticus]